MIKSITYIKHSGFLVEAEKCYLLFDYYKGEVPELDKNKMLYVFVSHRHPDHYNRDIWNWRKERENIRYVIAKDIPFSAGQREKIGLTQEEVKRVTVIRANEIYNLPEMNISVEALRSTDCGVAFIVTVEDQTIYHAGDLNNWKWEGETEEYNVEMELNYKMEVDKLKERDIDVAFLPLDPRQEKDAFLGIEYFVNRVLTNVKTDKMVHIFPMHFWNKPQIIREFVDRNPLIGKNIKVYYSEYAGIKFNMDN